MRYGVIIGVIVGLIGCGEVGPLGDGGSGTAGSGMAGTTGTGGAGGTSDACVPDACNTCVDGKKTPVADGTVCASSSCGGAATSPFGGTYAPMVVTPTCHAGACAITQIECSPQSCECGSIGVGYAGCFTDTGPAACKCVNAQGSYCGGA